MRGQLPDPNHRHRNAPTIPTTALPPGGRTAPAPKLPPTANLGDAGKAWWGWAWRTPQAAAWADGHEGIAARRASLEDDLAALENVTGLDLELLDDASRATIKRICALATGRLQIMREMRELDDRLGLSPKAMAQLRWSIKPDEAKADLVPVATSERWRQAS